MGEVIGNKNASFIALGSLPETVTCPGCGCAIDTRQMIAGAYDSAGSGGSGCLVSIVGVAAFGIIVIGLELPWWSGLLGALAFGWLTQFVHSRFRSKHGA
jgi:hypothetical protein